jgi:hypothetical protein
MFLEKFPYFVDISSIREYNVRRQAAAWALDQFGIYGVEVFVLGPDDAPGFWFRREEDAVLFSLKWLGHS